MTRAAIYFNPEAYGTAGPKLMGRHAAGEGFLHGLVRHGEPGPLRLWNYTDLAPERLARAVRDLLPDTGREVRTISRHDRRGLAEAGVVSIPTPVLGKHAWSRRHLGDAAYSLCGVTHTTVSVQDALVDLALAPVQPWDAVVVTSRSVRDSLGVFYEQLREHLRERLGAQRLVLPQFPVIPLGVDTGRFVRAEAARRAWRERLGVEPDDVVALYVGRFSYTSKMNPAPMAIALERAAEAAQGRVVHWVLAGWAEESQDVAFREAIMAQVLSLRVHVLDGRLPQVRSEIWSAADLFISLSDNVQETFGLTPVEAMAAGLPSVISDWNGYRDTVRDGVDGFRIPTLAPRAGLGRDLALNFAQGWATYDTFAGASAQFTAVDIPAAVSALSRLIADPELRARMGASAREHAREVFDWSRIIPQYEALWRELDTRRRAAAPGLPTPRVGADNPWRLDPFRLFGGYATARTGPGLRASLAPGVDRPAAEAMLAMPLVRLAPGYLPRPEEVGDLVDRLASAPGLPLEELLSVFPAQRRPVLERGLVWLAKYDLVRMAAADEPAASGPA